MTLARLKNVDDHGDRYQALMVWCPGCEKKGEGDVLYGGLHMLPVSGDSSKRPVWGWNNDLEKVTLSPSILSRGGNGFVCHSFLVDGVWEFLSDSTHKYSGQKVPMVQLPDWLNE